MKLVYPGSFDPVTNGHLDLIERASRMADELVVAILINPGKHPYFTLEERLWFLREATKHIPNVKVDSYNGLLVDYMRQVNSTVILRGLRAVSDFENELQWAMLNQKLDKNMEAVYLMTSSDNSFLSSSMVREIGSFGGDISSMVPVSICGYIREKLMQAHK